MPRRLSLVLAPFVVAAACARREPAPPAPAASTPAVASVTLPPTPMTPSKLSFVHEVHRPTRPSEGPAPLLVLLHGIGADEHDLASLAPHLDPRFLVVSARGPYRHGPGFAWFSAEFRPEGTIVDAAQAESSRTRLLGFLDELAATYPVDPARTFVAGFSQGAIMTTALALSAPKRLAGAVVMSGRMLPETWSNVAPASDLARLPMLVVHGTRDPVLPIANGRLVRDRLATLPVALEYAEFAMGHEISAESLARVAAWTSARLDAAR